MDGFRGEVREAVFLHEMAALENVYSLFSPLGHSSARTLQPGPPSAQLGEMGKLTTHVLDTASGEPAEGVRIRLFQHGTLLVETRTNRDGRCDSPVMIDPPPGEYELVFSMGEYFTARGVSSPFLNEIPVRFLIESGRNYHVPLACSPYSYSTYRGS